MKSPNARNIASSVASGFAKAFSASQLNASEAREAKVAMGIELASQVNASEAKEAKEAKVGRGESSASASNDAVAFAPSARVRVKGLVTKSELNGCVGSVVRWNPDKERYAIRLDGRSDSTIGVCAQNLEHHRDAEKQGPEVIETAQDSRHGAASDDGQMAEATRQKLSQFQKMLDASPAERQVIERRLDADRAKWEAEAALAADKAMAELLEEEEAAEARKKAQ